MNLSPDKVEQLQEYVLTLLVVLIGILLVGGTAGLILFALGYL